MRQTDVRQHHRLIPPPRGRGHNNDKNCNEYCGQEVSVNTIESTSRRKMAFVNYRNTTTTTTTNVLIIVTLHKVAGALYISDFKRWQ